MAPLDEIQQRMADDGSENWGLLAMCADFESSHESSLEQVRKEIAINVACLEALENKWEKSPFWSDLGAERAGVILRANSPVMLRFNLNDDTVEAIVEKDPTEVQTLEKTFCAENSDVSLALDRREQLIQRQKALRDRYAVETAKESAPLTAQQQNYLPLINKWVSTLAIKYPGKLEEMHTSLMTERVAAQQAEEEKKKKGRVKGKARKGQKGKRK